ncbi:MAG: hypothetical protein OIN86_04665 [Candidatus Methanoperedens sp.]|nr:hypothetical protein [Candidatus Methanoperedens sp.]CAG0996735.1 hypothetical protein METP1_02616 [Methanosarcinales archaeon]
MSKINKEYDIQCAICDKIFQSDDLERELCDDCQKAEDKMFAELSAKMRKKFPQYFEEKRM